MYNLELIYFTVQIHCDSLEMISGAGEVAKKCKQSLVLKSDASTEISR